MKSIKIFTITLLLASLAVGCQDKNDGHIRIFAESIGDHNAKVAFTPGNIPSGAEWIAGETVKLNGTIYNIAEESGQGFYLSSGDDGVQPLDAAMHAIYPGSSFGGNDVSATNTASGDGLIVLNRLVIEKMSATQQKMAFPMAAEANANESKLYFRHLTGGFRLNLTNSTGAAINLASLKIVAKSTTTVSHLGIDGVATARWADQGPAVPSGEVGGSSTDADVKYASVMNFDCKDGSNNYISIADGGSYMFCVPITISSVRYLTVTGYASDGTEIFNVTKDLGSEVAVALNRMYTIPDIDIN